MVQCRGSRETTATTRTWFSISISYGSTIDLYHMPRYPFIIWILMILSDCNNATAYVDKRFIYVRAL